MTPHPEPGTPRTPRAGLTAALFVSVALVFATACGAAADPTATAGSPSDESDAASSDITPPTTAATPPTDMVDGPAPDSLAFAQQAAAELQPLNREARMAAFDFDLPAPVATATADSESAADNPSATTVTTAVDLVFGSTSDDEITADPANESSPVTQAAPPSNQSAPGGERSTPPRPADLAPRPVGDGPVQRPVQPRAPTPPPTPTPDPTPTPAPTPTSTPTPTPESAPAARQPATSTPRCEGQTIRDAAGLAIQPQLAIADAIVRCDGAGALLSGAMQGVNLGDTSATQALHTSATSESGDCLDVEIARGNRQSILLSLVRLGVGERTGDVDRAAGTQALAACFGPAGFSSALSTSLLVGRPEIAAGLDNACADTAYATPGRAEAVWNALLEDPVIDDTDREDRTRLDALWQPTTDCISFGRVIAAGASIDLPANVTACIDAAAAQQGMLVSLLANELAPDDPAVTTTLIACLDQ